MQYLKLFEKQTDYQSFIESDEFVTPNVSFVIDENLVFYNAQEGPSILKASYNATSDNMICLQDSSNVKTLTIDGEKIEFEPLRFEIETINIKGGDIIQDENGIITNPFDGAISYVPNSWSFKPADNNIKVTDIEHILMIQAVEGIQVGGVVSKDDFDGMIVVDSNTNSFTVSDTLLSQIKNILEGCDAIGFACCSLNEETGNFSVIDTISNVGRQATIETTIEINSSEIRLNEDGETAVFPNSYCVNFAPSSWQIKPQDDNIKISELSYLLCLIQHNNQQIVQAMPFAKLVEDDAYFNLNEENNSVDASTFLQIYPSSVLAQGQVYGWAFCKVDESTSAITEIIDTVQFLEKPTGLPSPYMFNTIGEHEVEIELVNETFVSLHMFAETTLKDILIPDSVTSIGVQAFQGCSSLTSIVIPDSVTSIENYAFYGCSSLTSINIPDSVTSIGDEAFSSCSGLTSINIPDSVTSIRYQTFYNCSSLTSIVIPDSVTSIGIQAFRDCSKLTSIEIPDSVTSIESSAFSGCTGLTEVTIGSGVTSIGEGAFYGCTSLTSIDIPYSITSIEHSTFRDCSKLTSINIPDSVTSIGGYAFQNCSGLISINIPDSVTSIGNNAFYGCSGLTSVVIPDSVTSIGGYAFQNCSGLTSIEIPNSVTSIGSSAFSGCKGLTSITIPDSVTSIGSNAFRDCSGLTSIDIPDSVASIGDSAFYGCSSLTSITCYAPTAPTITSSTFQNVKPNGTLYVPAGSDYSSWMNTSSYYLGNSNWLTQEIGVELPEITLDGYDVAVLMQPLTTTSNTMIFGSSSSLSSVTEINVDGSVLATPVTGHTFSTAYDWHIVRYKFNNHEIPNYAFSSCGRIKEINISDSVASIGVYAFYGCSGLTLIEIPNSVTSIGFNAFQNCSGLISINIPDSVTSIGSSAFAFCKGLTELTIGSGVTSIGGNAFQSCSSLTSITCYAPTAPTIGNNAFYGVKSNGVLYYPSGSDYSSWLSRLGSNWTGQEIAE